MEYAFFHLRVRNDNKCPICRKHYISLHKTADEAHKEASNYLDALEIENLKRGCPIWVDEWERRRNGDKYQVCEAIPEIVYNLANHDVNHYDSHEENYYYEDYFDFDDDLSGEPKLISDYKYEDEGSNDQVSGDNQNSNGGAIQYMLLHVRINRFEWCPDNINYWVSFYTSLDAACEGAPKILDSNDRENLKKMEPVWKAVKSGYNSESDSDPDPDKAKGNHYQIIKLEYGKRLCLNEYCKRVQPAEW
jgi:hypothetical protein